MRNQALTIDELYRDLAKLRKAGFGKKKILISQDDEGNGYHELFYSVNIDVKSFGLSEPWAAGMLPYGVSPDEAENDYVILG